MAGNITRIPKYVVAKRPKQLVKLMFENNLKHKRQFNYFQITYDNNDKLWYAWYYFVDDDLDVLR